MKIKPFLLLFFGLSEKKKIWIKEGLGSEKGETDKEGEGAEGGKGRERGKGGERTERVGERERGQRGQLPWRPNLPVS